MTNRLKEIYSVIPECEVFADIGCDHGLMTLSMLKGEKCKRAIISDVSKKCLEKAQTLLAEYIEKGIVNSAVSDGFDNLPECDLALIAGMGGEEIISILKRARNLPEKLVLQPMKNSQKVRQTVIGLGYKFIKDYVFFSGGIFYDLMVLVKGEENYSQEEIEFGRDNLKGNLAFKKMIQIKIEKIENYLGNSAVNEQTKRVMLAEIDRLNKYV